MKGIGVRRLEDPRAGEVIRLSVPRSLEYREIAVRVVAAACGLVRAQQPDGSGELTEEQRTFDDQVVSGFGEAFSNLVLHGRGARDDIEIEIEPRADRLTIRLMDHGVPFEPSAVPPPRLEVLPEHGMGLYIIRSSIDDVSYQPGEAGAANVLSLTKRVGNFVRIDDGDETVLRIQGVLDAVAAPLLRPTVDAIVEQRRPHVVVDVSGLRHIDSSGVGVIVSLYKRCRAFGGQVRVTGAKDQPLSILKLLRLDRVFQLS